MIFKKYNDAEDFYQNLCQKYLYDYRPWIGLIEILIKTNTESNDDRYKLFIDKALSLCDNEITKKELSYKYEKYLGVNNKVLKKSFSIDVKDEKELLNDAIKNYNNKKYDLSFDIFKKFAHNGEKIAQYYLGNMYNAGLFVSKNEKEACKWYQLSANQGHAQSQYNLALMYQYGIGVSRSIIHAKFGVKKHWNRV